MNEPARRGRPARGDARATAQIKAGVTPAEKVLLEERAEAAGLDLSEYFRRAVFAYDATADER